MSAARDEMIRALKAEFVPVLKALGFEGRFPHFKRTSPASIDLLMVQFNRYGGSFVVEIATAPLNGITYRNGNHVPVENLEVGHTLHRWRLGAKGGEDCWFEFSDEDPVEVTRRLVPLLQSEAEPWWKSAPQHLTSTT
jgi:hypothetical protein